MVRAFREILGLTGDPSPRRRRQRFVPSMAESASCLEGRALLSGAGGAARHAMAAHHAANPAATAAGRRVTALFESILHTAPTDQQLARWVHKLHSGVSIKVLRKDLVADVGAPRRIQASAAMNASIAGGQLSTSASGRSTADGSGGLPTFVRGGINSPGGPIAMSPGAVQLPRAARLSLSASAVAHSLSITINRPVTTQPPGTTVTTPLTTSSTPNGATTMTTPLGSLLMNGVVPTPVGTGTSVISTIGPQGPLIFTPVTFSPIPFTPTMFPVGSVNPSPAPLNGTLPFTGTPFNPSPAPLNGTLPFTGTPFNPSPVPLNGTLPFTGTPFNPSPVAPTGVLF